MSNFSQFLSGGQPNVVITQLSTTSIGVDFANVGGTLSNASVTANKAYYTPFIINKATTITKISWYNGAAVAGNVDAGIYTAAGVKVISTGATAQSGTSALQTVDITDTLLVPGQYYMAISFSSNVTLSSSPTFTSATLGKLVGILEEASAHPLPATATFATFSETDVPLIIMTVSPRIVV